MGHWARMRIITRPPQFRRNAALLLNTRALPHLTPPHGVHAEPPHSLPTSTPRPRAHKVHFYTLPVAHSTSLTASVPTGLPARMRNPKSPQPARPVRKISGLPLFHRGLLCCIVVYDHGHLLTRYVRDRGKAVLRLCCGGWLCDVGAGGRGGGGV